MNAKQIEFLKNKPYLLRAFEQITEEDKQFMWTLDAEKVSKEQYKKLQTIVKKMINKLTFKEKLSFNYDLITLIKLWNEQ